MDKSEMKIGFFGDSIFYGYHTPYESRCWRVFEKLSGIDVVSTNKENPLGFPGAGIFDLMDLSDSLFIRYSPDIVFLCIGANHFDSSGKLMWPYGISESFFLETYSRLFEKFGTLGIEVIWAGIPPLEGGGLKQEKALEWSFKIGRIAEEFNFKSTFFTESIISLPQWDAMGGVFYGNLALDIHPNSAGQEFIGAHLSDYILKSY